MPELRAPSETTIATTQGRKNLKDALVGSWAAHLLPQTKRRHMSSGLPKTH